MCFWLAYQMDFPALRMFPPPIVQVEVALLDDEREGKSSHGKSGTSTKSLQPSNGRLIMHN